MQWLTATDYCIVAFTVVLIISNVQWFTDGRKHFKGPRVDLEVLQPAIATDGGNREARSVGVKGD